VDRKANSRLCTLSLAGCLAASPSCSSPSCSSDCPRNEAPERSSIIHQSDDIGFWHSFRASRGDTASETSLLLLRARYGLRTREFDMAILNLAKVICLGASEAVQAEVSKAKVEHLYPFERIGECVTVVCGGCQLATGIYLHGNMFTDLPTIGSVPFPSESMILPIMRKP
jgi:hypothetical protein